MLRGECGIGTAEPSNSRPGRALTAVILPALDEERALPVVLRTLPRELVDDIIVVDNGSRDGTARVAREGGARVVTEPERGYGSACLAGIAALTRETAVVVFLDADSSDDPTDLHRLLSPILDGHADFVLGDRTATPSGRDALLAHQRWGNGLATALIRWCFGFSYRDLGPFRAIRRDALDSLCMADRTFGWTVEMQVKAVRQQLRIREVPVHYRSRIGTSKVSGTIRGTLLAGIKILLTIAGHIRHRPASFFSR